VATAPSDQLKSQARSIAAKSITISLNAHEPYVMTVPSTNKSKSTFLLQPQGLKAAVSCAQLNTHTCKAEKAVTVNETCEVLSDTVVPQIATEA